MQLNFLLDCYLCNIFVAELQLLQRFMQHGRRVTINVLRAMEYGHRMAAPVLQKMQLAFVLELGGCICNHIFIGHVNFIMSVLWKVVLNNMIMAIITSPANYITLYNLNIQYISCAYILRYDEI